MGGATSRGAESWGALAAAAEACPVPDGETGSTAADATLTPAAAGGSAGAAAMPAAGAASIIPDALAAATASATSASAAAAATAISAAMAGSSRWICSIMAAMALPVPATLSGVGCACGEAAAPGTGCASTAVHDVGPAAGTVPAALPSEGVSEDLASLPAGLPAAAACSAERMLLNLCGLPRALAAAGGAGTSGGGGADAAAAAIAAIARAAGVPVGLRESAACLGGGGVAAAEVGRERASSTLKCASSAAVGMPLGRSEWSTDADSGASGSLAPAASAPAGMGREGNIGSASDSGCPPA